MRDFNKRLQEVCTIEVDENNPSQPVQIKEVLHPLKQCTDCDLMVREQLRHITINNFPKRYTKTKCMTCNTYKHPVTGEFGASLEDIRAYNKERFGSPRRASQRVKK